MRCPALRPDRTPNAFFRQSKSVAGFEITSPGLAMRLLVTVDGVGFMVHKWSFDGFGNTIKWRIRQYQ